MIKKYKNVYPLLFYTFNVNTCLNFLLHVAIYSQFYDCKMTISYRIITVIVLVLTQIYEV
ncbi:putative membrane protein [Acinetobacter baumannii 146457]|nr:putative membrane protein [Acinetobacter baumannii 146457]